MGDRVLRLRVLFNCRDRIYDGSDVIGYTPVYEKQVYLKNWQEVLDYIKAKSFHDIDCEVFDIVPSEIPF